MPNDYLVRQDCSWCFRMAVPPDLQGLVGRTELRYALNTGSRRTAKTLTGEISSRVKTLFAELRREGNRMTELNKDQINEIIREYVQESIDSIKDHYATTKQPLNSDTLNHQLLGIEAVKEDYKEAKAYRKRSVVYPQVDRLLEAKGITIDRDSDLYQWTCNRMLTALIALSDVEYQAVLGKEAVEYSDDLKALLGNAGQAQLPQASPGQSSKTSQAAQSLTLGDMASEYWDEHQKDWKPRTKLDYRRYKNYLLEKLGSKTFINQIDYHMMKKYRDGLVKRGLDRSTIKSYVDFAKAIFNFAMRTRRLDYNPAQGLTLKRKKRPDTERDIFTKSDLKKLFCESEAYTKDTHEQPSRFWIPILGLYTGCRLEELCQLYCENVRKVQGVWCLDINERKPDQSVKTSEERLVPLHPFLVEELDFIGYVKSLDQKGRVFPELNYIRHRYSHTFTQWFSKFKTSCGIVAPPRKKVFHSFRHTLATALERKDVPERHISMLVGHAIEGM